jgi:hypothetical protein
MCAVLLPPGDNPTAVNNNNNNNNNKNKYYSVDEIMEVDMTCVEEE